MSKDQKVVIAKKNTPAYRKLDFSKIPVHWDVFAGIISGFLVSPSTTIIDRSVIESANGKTPLWTGVYNGFKTLFTRPHIFLNSFEFKWLLFVYTSTYASSNLADHWQINGVDPSIVKLMTTFTVNTTTSIIKDKALTQKFGLTQKRSFPLKSYGIFFLRDIIAMAAAFTVPSILGEQISRQTNIDHKNGLRIAQMISPMLAQFIGTPLHLIGLDFYNNPHSTIAQRLKFLSKTFINTLFIRMLRFLPTYGIGGIANIEIRSYFKQRYAETEGNSI